MNIIDFSSEHLQDAISELMQHRAAELNMGTDAVASVYFRQEAAIGNSQVSGEIAGRAILQTEVAAPESQPVEPIDVEPVEVNPVEVDPINVDPVEVEPQEVKPVTVNSAAVSTDNTADASNVIQLNDRIEAARQRLAETYEAIDREAA